MNDFELEAKLKRVRPPERTEEYWDDFPTRVRRQLRHAAPAPAIRGRWRPQFAWRFVTGFACGLVGLAVLSQPLKAAAGAIFQKEQIVRQKFAALPGQLRVLMADEHGLHYLVVDKD